MPSIADAYVTIFPETSRIAAGIKAAFREVDGRETGRRLGREIQEGIGDTKVTMQADSTKAKSELDEASRDRQMTVHAQVDRSQLSQIGSTVSATLVDAASKAGAAMRPAVQSIEKELEKASAAVAKLENQQADAAGKARVAQERVNEALEVYSALQDKGTAKASRMAAAEEAVAKARRDSISAGQLEADLADQLESRRSSVAKLQVDADTAKAEGQIDEAARDRKSTIKVDVDSSKIAQLGSQIAPAAAQAGTQAGSAMGTPFGGALLAAGITAIAGIASAASGLAGLIPAALGGAGLGIGTLVIGLDGVKDAWDAVGKAAKDSGVDQAAKAKEVTSATRSLNAAVKDEAQAQKDVATARKDALHQLQDLNLELHGGALDEKQAYLDTLKARQDLATGTYATSVDYEQAQLRVMQADQHYAEAKQRTIDLQAKAADERAKGVDGADQVVAANNRLADTQDRVSTAQQALDAANNKVSSSAKDAAEKMALLSPAGQTLITTLQGMMPQFQAFKFAIQDALLTGLGPQIQQLATTYLPMLQGAMGSMASTMNQAFGSLAQLFQTPEMLASMQSILGNISGSFATWSQSIVPLAQAFTKLTEVGSTFLPQLADGAVQAAQSFAQFISEASQSGQLQQWIQTGITTMTQLGGIIQQLGPIFLALAPIGTAVLTGIQTILASLAPSIGPLSTAFAALITAVTPILGVIGQLVSVVITSVAPALTTWLNTLAPVIQQMAGLFQPVLEALAPVLQQVAGTLANTMVTGIQTLLPVLVPFVAQMGQMLIAVVPLLPALVQLAVSALPVVQQALALILPYMTEWMEMCVKVANVIIPPLTKVVETMGKMFGTAFNAIKNVVGPVWDFVRPILEKMKSLLDDITAPLERLGLIPSDSGKGGSGAHGGAVIPKGSGTGIIPIGPAFTGLPPTGLPFTGLPPSTGGVGGSGTGGLLPGMEWGGKAPVTPAGTAPVTTYMPPGVAPSGMPTGGYPGDAALLANVPKGVGQYDNVTKDLSKGLVDCASGVEDLVNIIDGKSTAGGSLWTGNAASVLPGMGFVPGMGGPGDFRIGYNSGHMQATLPGGTNVNYGSTSAIQAGGLDGGMGAYDPAFTSHYYRPANGAGGAVPGMPTGQPTNPMYVALSPNIPAGQQAGNKNSGGQQLGQDFMGGIAEIFGIDGSVFKDPTQFGLFKIFKGLMGLKPAQQGGGGSSSDGGGFAGGGGGGLGGLLSFIPQAVGDLKIGSPKDAPGQFMPMPGQGGSGGGGSPILPNPFAAPNDPSRVAGPGNYPPVNIDMSGSSYGYSQTQVQDQIQHGQTVASRQPLRALPS